MKISRALRQPVSGMERLNFCRRSYHPSDAQGTAGFNCWKRALTTVTFAAFVILGACAGVTHHSIPDAEADLQATGLRYYDTSPYLFIHTDNQGGLTSNFVYLPDTTKKRSAKPFAILAKNKTTLTWDEDAAALTGSSSEVDTGEVPKAIVTALEDVAKTFVKGAIFDTGDADAKGKVPPSAPRAYIFKVIKREGNWGLVGASTDQPLYLTN